MVSVEGQIDKPAGDPVAECPGSEEILLSEDFGG